MSDDSPPSDKEETSDRLDDELTDSTKTDSAPEKESESESEPVPDEESEPVPDEESEPTSDTEPENISETDSDDVLDVKSDETEETSDAEEEPAPPKRIRGDSAPLLLVSPPKGEEEKENEEATFATDDAPWVGAEKKWRAQSGIPEPPDQIDQPHVAYDSRDSAPSDPDLYREDSFIPGNIGPDSLPVLAANQTQDSGKMSAEAKLGVAAAFMAIVVLIAAAAWWRIEDEGSKTSALMAAKQQQIDRLKEQIANFSSTNNPEDLKKVARLQAELGAVETNIVETAIQPETETKEKKSDEVDKDTDKNQKRIPEREKEKEDSKEEVPADKGETPPTPESSEKESDIADDPYGSPPPSSADNAPEPSPYGSSSVAPKAKSEMDDLIDQAIDTPSKIKDPWSKTEKQSPAGQPPAPAEQPSTNPSPSAPAVTPSNAPSRIQVKAAMSAVAPGVKRCGGSGRIVLKIAVAGATGRVLSAQPISPGHDGTPLGICATRAVKLAKFPKFSQSRLVIKYPFDL
ncbi:MAG: hypothetical protein GY847_17700 [Proteobacteria bacterium]|nr:hypothetical protein [Pseudomonadota bacterium]